MIIPYPLVFVPAVSSDNIRLVTAQDRKYWRLTHTYTRKANFTDCQDKDDFN